MVTNEALLTLIISLSSVLFGALIGIIIIQIDRLASKNVNSNR